jgi:hypothetical protein
MSDPIVLPVTFISQLPGLCGAACAQMLLNARGIGGTSDEDQEALWQDIKAHTVRKGANPAGDKCSFCGVFDTQICEPSGDCAQCWCTHPKALADTLNARLPGASFGVRIGTEEEVTAIAINSINRHVPAVMLVYGARHWVVVNGYTPVASGGLVFGEHRVSQIHILNPEWLAADNTRLAVVAEDWTAFYMAEVPFGTFKDSCVVVAEGV